MLDLVDRLRSTLTASSQSRHPRISIQLLPRTRPRRLFCLGRILVNFRITSPTQYMIGLDRPQTVSSPIRGHHNREFRIPRDTMEGTGKHIIDCEDPNGPQAARFTQRRYLGSYRINTYGWLLSPPKGSCNLSAIELSSTCL